MTEEKREPPPRRRSSRPAQRDEPAPASRNGRAGGSAAKAARRAAAEVAELTGHQPESVISIERHEDGWEVGVEVVESHRIPDSADILATYLVRIEGDGELLSYHRVGRYARGQMDRERR